MGSGMAAASVLAAIAGGYLVGSISFAVVVSRLMGLADPRTYGSQNPGATNVLRSGSNAAAVLTLVGDAVKGAVAVWLARRFGASFGVGDWGIALAGLAAFVGHLYPLYFGFKGGKGVATYFGVLAVFSPWIALTAAGAWLLIAVFFRYSSLASLTAAVVAPLAQLLAWGFEPAFVALMVMSGLLVMRHQKNIVSLMAGKERRIGAKTGAAAGKGY